MEEYLYDSLYFGISKLHRNVARVADEAFKEIQLAPSYAILMMLLDEWKELSPTQISDSLDISPSTTTRFLDKLVRMNLVERRYDGIYSYVSLSLEGQQKIPQIKGIHEELEYKLRRLFTSKLSTKAKPLIMDMATTIHDNIKK